MASRIVLGGMSSSIACWVTSTAVSRSPTSTAVWSRFRSAMLRRSPRCGWMVASGRAGIALVGAGGGIGSVDDPVVAAMLGRPIACRVVDGHERLPGGDERHGPFRGETLDARVHQVPTRLVDVLRRALPQQRRVVEVAHQGHPLTGHLARLARVDLRLEV